MNNAVKHIAYASVLGAASMFGAPQTNADVVNIANTSYTNGVGGDTVAIDYIDDSAVTNGYDEGLDDLYTPREPAHPMDRYFTLSQNVEGLALEFDYRPPAELGDTYFFDATAINDSGEEFTANNYFDFTGTTLNENPNGVTDFEYLAVFDTDLNGSYETTIGGSVMDAIQHNDGKTESWNQTIATGFDEYDGYGIMQLTAVPEPSSGLLLVLGGLAALGGLGARNTRTKALKAD